MPSPIPETELARSPRRRWDGFSLIELMVVLAIISVLMAIVLPSYQEYRVRANRGAAQAVLLEIVSRQEQYAASNRAYFATPAANNLGSLGMTVPTEVTTYYDITVTLTNVLGTNDGFIATATAKGSQADDGDLAVNQFGLRTPTAKW